MKVKPIVVEIPLSRYLRQITKGWEKPYVTKTYGGQVWVSDEAPGECFPDDSNYIELNDSNVFFKLPKEVHQHIDLEPGCHKTLSMILKEIKQKESSGSEGVEARIDG